MGSSKASLKVVLHIDNNELLKYALENGIINLEVIHSEVEMSKRDELLKKHPYKIWCGTDGKWRTYLPDRDKGRVLKKLATEQAIKDCVVEYWRQQAENPTVRDIYDEWIENKTRRKEISVSTKNRYDRQYKQCIEDFGNRKINAIDSYDVEEFLLDTISDKNLTPKGYSNLKTILFGVFRLAKKKKYIDFSISETIADMEISRKSFRRVNHSDDEVVFSDEEINLLKKYFSSRELDIKDLGIILLFYTGMRPGELAGLEWQDVFKDRIHISRTEIRYEDENSKYVYEVRNFPKTEAGIRDILIPEDASWIIKEIRRINPFGQYVFAINNQRIKACCFDDRLRIICRRVGITEKSLNKIRKTYATMLLDNHVEDSLIMAQMGHTDIHTTKIYYYKKMKTDTYNQDVINKVFSKKIL